MTRKPPGVLVIVQNLPVPMDRRVWLECQELRRAGYDVAVICPKAPGDPDYAELDGVHLHKYSAPPAATGVLGYLVEFVYCWLVTAKLSLTVRRRHGFDVIQACNPPDTYWLLALLWRPLGVRFVYDQHDLNPELFLSRFGQPRSAAQRAQFAVLVWLERMTYRVADLVISTNESYRSVAMGRGRRRGQDVTVVRSGPDTSTMRPVEPRPELRSGATHLLGYVGIMGPQDNVDVLLRVMADLVNRRARTDIHLALMGFGDCLESLKALCHDLGLDEVVTFTGRADHTMMASYLSTASLGLCPDLKTPLNDVSTHNKTMEYMAYGLPVVTFDLTETRVSAQDCAVYVPSGDEEAFATAICDLLDDPQRRARMAANARERCVSHLDWRQSAPRYVEVFGRLTGWIPTPSLQDDSADVLAAELAGLGVSGQDQPAPVLASAPTIIDLRTPTTVGESDEDSRRGPLPAGQPGGRTDA